ncbi:SAM-dependent methyltransferase, partial [Propionibacterium freudenreichii]|nr:SAM-dependent methyltransferase [Propionibacterium freudenreichii]
MDLHTAQLLTSPEGERALTLATGLPDPDSLGAGERMRREFAPEL